jgi:hypothetical protein
VLKHVGSPDAIDLRGELLEMINKTATLGVFVTALVSTMFAQEGRAPKGVPNLDHVFVIMMENHG